MSVENVQNLYSRGIEVCLYTFSFSQTIMLWLKKFVENTWRYNIYFGQKNNNFNLQNDNKNKPCVWNIYFYIKGPIIGSINKR